MLGVLTYLRFGADSGWKVWLMGKKSLMLSDPASVYMKTRFGAVFFKPIKYTESSSFLVSYLTGFKFRFNSLPIPSESSSEPPTSMAGDDVLLGRWTNWSRGPVFGPTLTMTQENGKYLIAFIAFFVAFVASRFWMICCFFLHRFYSTKHPSAAPHHQRQAILRNSSSPESGLALLLRLYWAWRQPHLNQLLALLFPAVVAFIVLTGFALAGVFSSQISSTVGNEVLLSSSARCGIMIGTSNLTDAMNVVRPYQSRVVDNAVNYAQQCYSSSDSSMVDCNRFVAPRLPAVSVDYAAGCPFESNMCRTNASNLRIDSGYIDSNRDLGINTAADERFTWRTVLHCAPLVTEGYRSNVTRENQTFIRYNYGRTIGHGYGNYFNYTYEVGDFAQQYPDPSELGAQEIKEFRLK